MGLLLQDQGKLTEAEPYHREALEGSRRVLGDDHPHTLESIDDMGNLLQSQAFVFPMNGDENYGSRSLDLWPFLTSVDIIETLTGLDFLTDLDDETEELTEEIVHTELWATDE